MGPTLYPENAPSLPALCIAWIVTVSVVIVLRFWSRYALNVKKVGWDDWTALAAWPFVVSTLVVAYLLMHNGFGLHQSDVPPESPTYALKVYWAGWFTINTAMALIRILALLFYLRVFETGSKIFMYNFKAGVAANIAWLIGMNFLVLFNCIPIRSFWDRTIPGKCVNIFQSQIGYAVTSVLLDLWILLIRRPMLWTLNLSLQRRILITGVFVLGCMVVVFSIGRVLAVLITGDALITDITDAFVTSLYWFVCETSVAFTCLRLPSMLHLGRGAKIYGFQSLLNDRQYYRTQSVGSVQSPDHPHQSGTYPAANSTKTGATHLEFVQA